MLPLTNPIRDYPWGSPTAVPELFGWPVTGAPVAELWLGAHPSSPSLARTSAGDRPLDELIAADPAGMLGEAARQYGDRLPYLLKVIGVAAPLSLQVHPDRARAHVGYDAEEAAGVPIDAPQRSYRDRNHKPELALALTEFHALAGFRALGEVASVLAGLPGEVASDLRGALADGVAAAFRRLLEPATRPSQAAIDEFAEACRDRAEPLATVARLAEAYPGDPGTVISLLLNQVVLAPGQAMFLPPGCVHAYLRGVAVELMANSDNVLRAGLTGKHVDVAELLANVDLRAAPPLAVAPQPVGETSATYPVPVPDFRLTTTTADDGAAHLPGRGPRVVLALAGGLEIASARGTAELGPGESVFVPASEGELWVRGRGRLVQADVP